MSESNLPAGFQFSGVSCGIKPSGKPDVSLIVGDGDLIAAGVYTTNQIVAAPVTLCRSRTPSGSIRAVVTNSGNANACTGEQGDRDAAAMCRLVADKLNVSPEQVLVMSTGIIGQVMPMDRVESGIENAAAKLGDSIDHFDAAADAILTTDQSRKVAFRELSIGGKSIRLCGMVKGAGMIAPNMATMLGVLMTDLAVEPEVAQRLLKSVADETFNRVSVDGHTSTNDTLLFLSSGKVVVEIDSGVEHAICRALKELSVELATQLVADGEGAEHVLRIEVCGARNERDAEIIAREVGASLLVKTAVTGGDPNWGRIVSAAGYAGPPIDPQQTSLTLCGTRIYENGTPNKFDAAALSEKMKASPEVKIELIVGSGEGAATHWASDLTVEYVRFNSEYTT
jgi:glutamate N-acetyltransferase/amino-acid N-acetyltransferase